MKFSQIATNTGITCVIFCVASLVENINASGRNRKSTESGESTAEDLHIHQSHSNSFAATGAETKKITAESHNTTWYGNILSGLFGKNRNDVGPDSAPIPLLEEVDGKLVFRKENLRKLMDPNVLKDRPIAIISITGALRTGKSFFLNLLLRYLKEEGWNSKNGEWLQGWNSSTERGLEWRGGEEAQTHGIVAWGKPIIIKRYDVEEIAVILLDNQGFFDHSQNTKESASIFALSTLFSSLQIFNVNKQIQANDLDYLQSFVEVAKTMTLPISDKMKSNVDNLEAQKYKPHFQGLTYLVRDWPNPLDYEYGNMGGMKYMEKFMSSNKGTDNQVEVKKYLKNTFQALSCFLMPEPGKKVRVSNERNRVITNEDFGEEFSKYVTVFAESYLHPHKIRTKNMGGLQYANVTNLLWYMETCADALISKNFLEIPSIMDLVADRARSIAMGRAESKFVETLTKLIVSMHIPSWEVFESMMRNEEQAVVDEFRRDTQYGSRGGGHGKDVEKLTESLHLRKVDLKNRMHERRAEYVENVTRKWLEESTEFLQNYRYKGAEDLERITQDRMTLLMKEHMEDRGDIIEMLQRARNELENLIKSRVDQFENIRYQKGLMQWLGIFALSGFVIAIVVQVTCSIVYRIQN